VPGLPTRGPIRYVPPKSVGPNDTLPRGHQNGYVDRFGNEWVKGPSRRPQDDFEWDVQLSPKGKVSIGHRSKDGGHVNVSPDGIVTH